MGTCRCGAEFLKSRIDHIYCSRKCKHRWGGDVANRQRQNRKWFSDRPLYAREWMLRNKYNLSLEDYDRMFETQNGLCALCGNPETLTRNGVVKRLAVDHDHETNRVRALLCDNCNHGLGNFMDDPGLMRQAAEYVEMWKAE